MGLLQEQILSSSPSLPLLSLNHVSYLCKSVAESAKFYQEVLGFVLIRRPSSFSFEGAWLFNYGIGIHLLQCNSVNDVQQKPTVINPKDNHISFQCTDIELLKRRLEDMGMKYETALVEEGGIFVDQIFFHDPDGYMIEICNCENIPILPLSACPLKKPQSYKDSKSSKQRSLAITKALNAAEMETRMMESLFTNMIDISM
ncbi:Glyoxalase-like domain [Macleaya cordata]|uniref:Glyoxalase-like domain n=1 Tax=Macleaya cordata TaxID=56857 RepID=A0A200RCH4_MACCD|nr:Glyoxalase-like domain [Macleaya cordata]